MFWNLWTVSLKCEETCFANDVYFKAAVNTFWEWKIPYHFLRANTTIKWIIVTNPKLTWMEMNKTIWKVFMLFLHCSYKPFNRIVRDAEIPQQRVRRFEAIGAGGSVRSSVFIYALLTARLPVCQIPTRRLITTSRRWTTTACFLVCHCLFRITVSNSWQRIPYLYLFSLVQTDPVSGDYELSGSGTYGGVEATAARLAALDSDDLSVYLETHPHVRRSITL